MNEGWQLVAQELLPFLNLLSAKEPDLCQERSTLLKAWWHLANVIHGWSMGGFESELSAELRNRLVGSAAKHIGILRSVLRDTPKVFKDENSTGPVSDFYQEAFYILLNFAAPWKCLKPLLLAFTQMNKRAVTSDLRAWHEYGRDEKPPDPYSECSTVDCNDNVSPEPAGWNWTGIRIYKNCGKSLLNFVLNVLKQKEKRQASSGDKQFSDKDFVEPRPVWRQCTTFKHWQRCALTPVDGRMETLFWLSQNDLNETWSAIWLRERTNRFGT